MRNFADANNPLAIPVSFAVLRERARRRKEAGEPWPYIGDPMLSGPRSFCNTRREDDKTTRWLARRLREPMTAAGDPACPAALVLARMFNRIETCETFFGHVDALPTSFEQALAANSVGPLRIALARQPKPHVGEAYTIPSLNGCGLDKGEGLLAFYADWFRDSGPISWRRQFEYWARPGVTPTLASVHAWFMRMEGVGSFVAGQFIADLKYAPPLSRAPDWFTWAAPGPGSKRGLNVVCGRALDAPWDDREWLRELRWLQGVINPRLEAIGDAPLHLQDLQNVACEVAKAWRFTRSGEPPTSSKGSRNTHRPPIASIPESETAFRVRFEEIYEGDRAALLKAGVGERNIAGLEDVRPDMLTLWRSYREMADSPRRRRARSGMTHSAD
jgi:hypothetical protein